VKGIDKAPAPATKTADDEVTIRMEEPFLCSEERPCCRGRPGGRGDCRRKQGYTGSRGRGSM